MSNLVVLITGANRGIGFELTRQYLINEWTVIATCRNLETAVALISLKGKFPNKLFIELMDITCPEKIKTLASKLSEENIKLDLVVNNAGYLDRENTSIHAINYANAEMCFKVNSLGPLYLTHCFLPLINKKRLCKIAVISSAMGSLSLEQSVDWYGYRMSKAAANMLVVNLSKELVNDNIAVVAVHPGWVQTDMGGSTAKENVVDSALGVMKVILNLSIDNTGNLYSFDGEELPF
ncbi:SDR family oxidoreductase [Paraglaciecola polaris]|uniref:C-factor n=1 Tax=Paraglaciecola polaris LMG 21857 TaxID=1129793 RepID=K6ZSR0_9ALTE|nr:SDR family oxidoreductase [Paraglaciecola polaris]GAC33312.1 C-factor [Paraglaciecola polaris LMG 21857]